MNKHFLRNLKITYAMNKEKMFNDLNIILQPK